jgi:manganese-dependent inorganic pyrophosphatase
MIYIFGHKNPDTDSICSAIALSRLKNSLGCITEPYRLGDLSKETDFVLNRYNVDEPKFLENVKTQVKDLEYEVIPEVDIYTSIMSAYKAMEENSIRTLPVCSGGRLKGIITMKDIAMSLIRNESNYLETNMYNLLEGLNGRVIVEGDNEIKGKIYIMALFHKTVKKNDLLDPDSITIVGDNYDNIQLCIDSGVKMIVLTDNRELPEKYVEEAKKKKVPIISVDLDTYGTAQKIIQCNFVSSIMKKSKIVRFNPNDFLEDVMDEMKEKRHTFYPVVDKNKNYLGFIGRTNLLSPNRKNVILVDHNEYGQSAEGIEEAKIIEIVDHHKIGSINTPVPISFRNMPVGSTCTIVYKMFKELGINIELEIAGLLMSGIISDTLLLRSPTTSESDRLALDELTKLLDIDAENYALEMFKAGTSLEGKTIEEIFYQDFKEFESDGYKIGISQVFTMDIDSVFNKKDELLDFIDVVHKGNNYYISLLLITDIIREGSYILYKGSDVIIKNAFNAKPDQGTFVEGLVSRKKQGVPNILESMSLFR